MCGGSGKSHQLEALGHGQSPTAPRRLARLAGSRKLGVTGGVMARPRARACGASPEHRPRPGRLVRTTPRQGTVAGGKLAWEQAARLMFVLAAGWWGLVGLVASVVGPPPFSGMDGSREPLGLPGPRQQPLELVRLGP